MGIADDLRAVQGGPGIASELKATQQVPIRTTDVTPDQAAEIIELGDRTGLPRDMIADNIDFIRETAAKPDFDAERFRAESPLLAEWLAEHPDHYALSRNDLDQMGTVEGLVNAMVAGPTKGFGTVELGRLGYLDMIKQLTPEGRKRLDMLNNQMDALPQGGNFLHHVLTGAGYYGAMLAEMAWGAKEEALGGAMVGSVVPGAGTATGATAGFASGIAHEAYVLEAGHMYLELSDMEEQQGLTFGERTKQGIAALVGLANAVLELGGYSAAANPIVKSFGKNATKRALASDSFRKMAAQFGKAYGIAVAGETGTEIMQELNNVLGTELAKAIDGGEWDDASMQEVMERLMAVAYETTATMILPAAVGPTIQAASYRGKVRKAKQHQAILDSIAGTADAETTQKLPAKMQEFIARVTRDGPVESLGIDLEQWNTYFQTQGLNPQDVAASIGQVDAYKAALDTGEVRIPTGDLPVKHLEGLMPDIRLGDSLSAREADAYAAELQEGFEPEAEPESVTRVTEDVRGQLLQAGVEPTAAEISAVQMGEHFRSLGERLGRDAFEVYRERIAVAARRPLPDVLRQAQGELDVLDPLLDRVRAGELPSQADVFGQSLKDFVREMGGVRDLGGELAAVEAVPFKKRLVDPAGVELDRAAEAAWDAGFIPENDTQMLVDALLAEDDVFAPGNEDQVLRRELDELEDLGRYLESVGIDLAETDNQAAKAALMAPDGVTLQQLEGEDVWFRGTRTEGAMDTYRGATTWTQRDDIARNYGSYKHAARINPQNPLQLNHSLTDPIMEKQDLLALAGKLNLSEQKLLDIMRRDDDLGHSRADQTDGQPLDKSWDSGYGIDTWIVADNQEIQEAARQAGFDALVYHGAGPSMIGDVELRPLDESIIQDLESSTFYQDKAHRTDLGLYSGVEQAVIDMQIPEWKKDKPAGGKAIWQKLQKMPGVKKEELEWIGVEEFLEVGDKFTREQVQTFVWHNGVEVAETIADIDEGESTYYDLLTVPWEQDVIDDRAEWEHRIEDHMYDFDKASDVADVYWLDDKDVDEWYEKNIDTVVERVARDMDDASYAEVEKLWLDDDVSAIEVIQYLEGQGINVFETMAETMRDDMEELAEQAAYNEYMADPYERFYHLDLAGGEIEIVGNDSVGYKIFDLRRGPRHYSNAVNQGELWSFNEAQIQALNYARDNDDLAYEDDETVAKWSDYVTEPSYTPDAIGGGFSAESAYREVKLKFPSVETGWGKQKQSRDLFEYNAHFDDPNILAFLRVTDRRTKIVGRPNVGMDNTYFIEELQSDWHQQGRQAGYKTGEDAGAVEEAAKLIEYEAYEAYRELPEDIQNKVRQVFIDEFSRNVGAVIAGNATDDTAWVARVTMAAKTQNILENLTDSSFPATDEVKRAYAARVRAMPEMAEVVKLWDESRAGLRQAKAERYGVPDAPFKGNAWLNLALKRALVQAAEEGYSRFAWADSATLQDRWSDRYAALYDTQYDTKMPSMVKKLTKQKPEHLYFDGRQVGERTAELIEDDKGYWVIEITPELREQIKSEGFSLFQEGKRGSVTFTDQGAVIQLFEHNLSTFLHESGHVYLQNLRDFAIAEGAPEQMMRDYMTVAKWLGVNRIGDELTVEQHEKWARAFEAYLREGKSPSAELRTAFARFRAWLKAIYRKVADLDVEINDEIRGVMDRLLATDEQIAAAKGEGRVDSLFSDAETAGVSEEVFAAYEKDVAQASVMARDKLQARLMQDLVREQQTWWKEQRKVVRQEVEREVNERPEYIALAALQRGTMPDGSPLPYDAFKLDGDELEGIFGKAFLKRLPRPYVYTRTGDGMALDAAAMTFGYTSGQDLVLALANARNRRELIEAETDQRMQERHPDALSDGTLAEEAEAALHTGDARAKVIEAELAMLRKRIQQGAAQRRLDREESALGTRILAGIPKQSIYRDMAQERVASMHVRDLTPGRYLQATQRHSRAAFKAVKAGDWYTASAEKQRELANLELHKAVVAARKEADAAVKYLKTFTKAPARKRLGRTGYLDQIEAILERYSLKPISRLQSQRRELLVTWANRQIEEGAPLDIPDQILQGARRIPYQDIDMDELRGVRDTVKQIAHLARTKDRLLKIAKQRTLNELAASLVETAKENFKAVKDIPLEQRNPRKSLRRGLRTWMAEHRKNPSYFRQLDGFEDGGLWWETMVKPLNEAGDREATMNAEAAERLQELFKRYNFLERRQFSKQVKYLVVGEELSKEALLAIALNTGNESNKQRLFESGLTPGQLDALLSNLDRRDWEFVQAIWDYIDEFWPEAAAVSQRVQGVAPQKIEAQEFTNAHGTWRGGYYPVKYEPAHSARSLELDIKDQSQRVLGGASVGALTKAGSQIERKQTSGGQILRVDLGVIFEHIAEAIHTTTHREALLDIEKVMKHPDVEKTIKGTLGVEAYSAIRDTYTAVAAGDMPARTMWEKFLNHARIGSSVVGMGLSITTAMIQPLGFAQSMVRVGPRWMSVALKDLGAHPVDSIRFVYANSEMMRNRKRTQLREINEIRNSVKPVDSTAATSAWFYMIAKMQQLVDVPTWLAAYEKSLAAGETMEQATAIADQTVLDTQSGGQIKDLAGIQRGGPFQKLWTNFYSYFSATMNLATEAVRRTGQGGPTWRLVADMMLLTFIPATLDYLMRDTARGDEKDEDTMIQEIAQANVAYLTGFFVGTREMSGAIQGFYGYQGPPGIRGFGEATKVVKDVGRAIEDGEWPEKSWKSVSQLAGILLHLPAGQFNRTVEGTQALAEGEGDVRALVFGPPRDE